MFIIDLIFIKMIKWYFWRLDIKLNNKSIVWLMKYLIIFRVNIYENVLYLLLSDI